MEKVVRDGKVAVLWSPGYGAGWYTWNKKYPQLLFHPRLVAMVEAGKRDEIENDLVAEVVGVPADDLDIYLGGARDLEIFWVPEGEQFLIEEYDGSESFRFRSDGELWLTA